MANRAIERILAASAGGGIVALLFAAGWGGVAATGYNGHDEPMVTTVVAAETVEYSRHGVALPPGLDRGERLLAELNCTTCHAVDEAMTQRLLPRGAPLLGLVGRHVSPDYLRAFVTDPHGVKPGTVMPDLLHGLSAEEKTQTAEALTHYLASLAGPMLNLPAAFTDAEIEQGKVLYHQIGCVACHGPLEPASVLTPKFAVTADDPYGAADGDGDADATGTGHDALPRLDRAFVPLGDQARKTNATWLAEFLKNPLEIRPHGRMPSMNLSDEEAHVLAGYLLSATGEGRDDAAMNGQPSRGPRWESDFEVDHDLVMKGREAFATLGCASCHEMGPARDPVESKLAAPALAELVARAKDAAGCLAPEVKAGLPDYRLDETDRAAIAATLARGAELRQTLDGSHAVATALAAFNCYACHARDGVGGAPSELNGYFTTLVEADLGDEGRIPPNLTGVGAKLRTGWLHAVLAEKGVARSHYMAVRMPQFGAANVGPLAGLLAGVDVGATDDGSAGEPDFDKASADDGRRLVGSLGMQCITCHTVAGVASTGKPGIDLAAVHERLRYDWFARYLHDPQALKPGTKMPAFWPEGKSPFVEIQGGDARKQIDAVWNYLSLGEFLPLPEGLEVGGYELAVMDAPIVFRTFVNGAGSRAVAVGFPEQIHAVFDAQAVRLAGAWRGRFLSAEGAWAGRGGEAVGPMGQDVIDMPLGPALLRLPAGRALAMPGAEDLASLQGLYKMRGYRLDELQRPIFLYDFGALRVEEQPLPVLLDAERHGLVRRFALTAIDGAPADDGQLVFNAGTAAAVTAEAGGPFVLDGERTVRFLSLPDGAKPVVAPLPAGQQIFLRLPDPAEGQSISFEVEMTW